MEFLTLNNSYGAKMYILRLRGVKCDYFLSSGGQSVINPIFYYLNNQYKYKTLLVNTSIIILLEFEARRSVPLQSYLRIQSS